MARLTGAFPAFYVGKAHRSRYAGKAARYQSRQGGPMTKRYWLLLTLCAAALAVVVTPVAAGKPHPHKAKKHEAAIYLSPGYTCSGGATDTSGRTYGFFKAKLKKKGAAIDV